MLVYECLMIMLMLCKSSYARLTPRVLHIPRTTIKSLALVDFVVEWTEVQFPTPDVTHEYWTMYFDGFVMAPSQWLEWF